MCGRLLYVVFLGGEVRHGDRSQECQAQLSSFVCFQGGRRGGCRRDRSIRAFAISTLIQRARAVLHEQNMTVLTRRDHERFIAVLDDADARPNPAMVKAARRYKKYLG